MKIHWFSKHCWIDNSYDELFRSASMKSYGDFVRNDLGKIIRIEQEKSISFFEISQNKKKYGFYIKNEFPKWYRVLRKVLSHRNKYTLATSHELKLIRFYEKSNIPVVVPVACGERRVFGVPVSGFLVQKEVHGGEFTKLVKNGSRKERIKLIKAYGKLMADLHSKGIISSAVRVTDLICTSNINAAWNELLLVIIDREKGKLECEEFTLEKCVYSLSFILKRFYVFIGEATREEVCCFLNIYLKYLDVKTKPLFKELFCRINCQQYLNSHRNL